MTYYNVFSGMLNPAQSVRQPWSGGGMKLKAFKHLYT